MLFTSYTLMDESKLDTEMQGNIPTGYEVNQIFVTI